MAQNNDSFLRSTDEILSSLTIADALPESRRIYEELHSRGLAKSLPVRYSTSVTYDDITSMRNLKGLTEDERNTLINLADAQAFAAEYSRLSSALKGSAIHDRDDIINLAAEAASTKNHEKRIRAMYDGVNGMHADTPLAQSLFSAVIRGVLSPFTDLFNIVGWSGPTDLLEALTPIGIADAEGYPVKIAMGVGSAAGFVLGGIGAARLGVAGAKGLASVAAKTIPSGFKNMVSPHSVSRLSGLAGSGVLGYGTFLGETRDAMRRYAQEELQEAEAVMNDLIKNGETTSSPRFQSALRRLEDMERGASGDTRGIEYLTSIVPAAINLIPIERFLGKIIRGTNGDVASAWRRISTLMDKNELPRVRASLADKLMFTASQAGLGGMSEVLEGASVEVLSELASRGRLATSFEVVADRAFDDLLIGAIASGAIGATFSAMPRFHSPDVEALSTIIEGRDTLIAYLASNPDITPRQRQILEAAQKITNINDLSQLVFGKTYDEIYKIQERRPQAKPEERPKPGDDERAASGQPQQTQPSDAGAARRTIAEEIREAMAGTPSEPKQEADQAAAVQTQPSEPIKMDDVMAERLRAVAKQKFHGLKTSLSNISKNLSEWNRVKATMYMDDGFLTEPVQDQVAQSVVRKLSRRGVKKSPRLAEIVREKVASRLALAVANPSLFEKAGASPDLVKKKVAQQITEEIEARVKSSGIALKNPKEIAAVVEAAYSPEERFYAAEAANLGRDVPEITMPQTAPIQSEQRARMLRPVPEGWPSGAFSITADEAGQEVESSIDVIDGVIRFLTDGKHKLSGIAEKDAKEISNAVGLSPAAIMSLSRLKLKNRFARIATSTAPLVDGAEAFELAMNTAISIGIKKSPDGSLHISLPKQEQAKFAGRKITISTSGDEVTVGTESGTAIFRKTSGDLFSLEAAPVSMLPEVLEIGAAFVGNISLTEGILGRVLSPFYSNLSSREAVLSYQATKLRDTVARMIPKVPFRVESPLDYDFKGMSHVKDESGILVFDADSNTPDEVASIVALSHLKEMLAFGELGESRAREFLSLLGLDTVKVVHHFLTGEESPGKLRKSVDSLINAAKTADIDAAIVATETVLSPDEFEGTNIIGSSNIISLLDVLGTIFGSVGRKLDVESMTTLNGRARFMRGAEISEITGVNMRQSPAVIHNNTIYFNLDALEAAPMSESEILHEIAHIIIADPAAQRMMGILYRALPDETKQSISRKVSERYSDQGLIERAYESDAETLVQILEDLKKSGLTLEQIAEQGRRLGDDQSFNEMVEVMSEEYSGPVTFIKNVISGRLSRAFDAAKTGISGATLNGGMEKIAARMVALAADAVVNGHPIGAESIPLRAKRLKKTAKAAAKAASVTELLNQISQRGLAGLEDAHSMAAAIAMRRLENIIPNPNIPPVNTAAFTVKPRSVKPMQPVKVGDGMYAVRDNIGWVLAAEIEMTSGRPTVTLKAINRARETDSLGAKRMQAAKDMLRFLESEVGANVAMPSHAGGVFDAEAKRQLLLERASNPEQFDPVETYEITASEATDYAASANVVMTSNVFSPAARYYRGELREAFSTLVNTILKDIPYELVRDDSIFADVVQAGGGYFVRINEDAIISVALSSPTRDEAVSQMRRILAEERMHYLVKTDAALSHLVDAAGKQITERIADEMESRGYSPTAAIIFSRRPELAMQDGPQASEIVGHEAVRIITDIMLTGRTTESFGFTTDAEVISLFDPIIQRLSSNPSLFQKFLDASLTIDKEAAIRLAEGIRRRADEMRSSLITFSNRAEGPYAIELFGVIAEKLASEAIARNAQSASDFMRVADEIIPKMAEEIVSSGEYGPVTEDMVQDLARMMMAQEMFRDSKNMGVSDRVAFENAARVMGDSVGKSVSNAGRLLALWGIMQRMNPEFQYQKFYRDVLDHIAKNMRSKDKMEEALAPVQSYIRSGGASRSAAIRAAYNAKTPRLSKQTISRIISGLKREAERAEATNDPQDVADIGLALADMNKLFSMLPEMPVEPEQQLSLIKAMEAAARNLSNSYNLLLKADKLTAATIFHGAALRSIPDQDLAAAIMEVRARDDSLSQEEFIKVLGDELRAKAKKSYEIAMHYLQSLPETEALKKIKSAGFVGLLTVKEAMRAIDINMKTIAGDPEFWGRISLALDDVTERSSQASVVNSIARNLSISRRAAKDIFEEMGGMAMLASYKREKRGAIADIIDDLGERLPMEIKKQILDIILDENAPDSEDMTADTVRDFFIQAFARNERILPEARDFFNKAREIILESAASDSPLLKRRALRRLEEMTLQVQGQGALEFLTAVRKASLTSGLGTMTIGFGASGLALTGSYLSLLISKMFRRGRGAINLEDVGAIFSAMPAIIRNGVDTLKQAVRGDYIGRQEFVLARPILESAEKGDAVRVAGNIALPRVLSRPMGYIASRLVRIPTLSDAFFSTVAHDLFLLTMALGDKENAIEKTLNEGAPVLNSARDIIDFFFDTESARMAEYIKKAEEELKDITDPQLKKIAMKDVRVRAREMALRHMNSRFLSAANVYGSSITMMRDLSGKTTGGLLGLVAGALNKMKYTRTNPAQRFLLEYLFPIVTAPINSVNFMLNFTPVAFVRAGTGLKFGPLREASEEFKAADPEILAMMRVMGVVGTAASLVLVALAIGSLDDDDEERFFDITGGLDVFDNFARRQAAIDSGITPYSVRVGNLSFVYKDVAPHLAVIGNVVDSIRYAQGGSGARESRRKIENALTNMVMQAPLAVASMSAFEPLLNMVSQKRGADARAFDAFKRELGRGAATYFSPALIKDLQAALDDKRYVIAPEIHSQFLAGLPLAKVWGGQGREVLYNIFGEPAKENRNPLGRVLRDQTNARRDAYASAIREALENGHSPVRNPTVDGPNPRDPDGQWNTRDVSILRNRQVKHAMGRAREVFERMNKGGALESMDSRSRALLLREVWRDAYRSTSRAAIEDYAKNL